MIKQCPVCGNDFKTYPSKIKIGRGKYCSKECCLSVTNKVLEENGKQTRFIKGQEVEKRQEPWNKGMKGIVKRCRPHNYQGHTYTSSRTGGKKYILIHIPEHPNCDKKGYMREHRLVVEEKIKRLLNKNEIVHHIDGDTENNNIDNLQAMTRQEHDSLKNNPATYGNKY